MYTQDEMAQVQEENARLRQRLDILANRLLHTVTTVRELDTLVQSAWMEGWMMRDKTHIACIVTATLVPPERDLPALDSGKDAWETSRSKSTLDRLWTIQEKL